MRIMDITDEYSKGLNSCLTTKLFNNKCEHPIFFEKIQCKSSCKHFLSFSSFGSQTRPQPRRRTHAKGAPSVPHRWPAFFQTVQFFELASCLRVPPKSPFRTGSPDSRLSARAPPEKSLDPASARRRRRPADSEGPGPAARPPCSAPPRSL